MLPLVVGTAPAAPNRSLPGAAPQTGARRPTVAALPTVIFLRSLAELERALAARRVGFGDIVHVPFAMLAGQTAEQRMSLQNQLWEAGAEVRLRQDGPDWITVVGADENVGSR